MSANPRSGPTGNGPTPGTPSRGAESFAGLIGRVTGFLGRLGTRDTGPVAVFTHGIFVRAVAWYLLTGVADPGPEDMSRFHAFTGLYPVPNVASQNVLRKNRFLPIGIARSHIFTVGAWHDEIMWERLLEE